MKSDLFFRPWPVSVAVSYMALLIIVFASGCNVDESEVSPGDWSHLQQLRQQYGDIATFQLGEQPYLEMRLLSNTRPSRAMGEEVYTTFFLQEGSKRDTEYHYLNLYNDTGDFLFQVAYDVDDHRFVVSRTEHY